MKIPISSSKAEAAHKNGKCYGHPSTKRNESSICQSFPSRQPIVQTKLELTQAGDSYEQEAERTADFIMRKEFLGKSGIPVEHPSLSTTLPSLISRRASGDAGVAVDAKTESGIYASRGGRHGLPDALRSRMEVSFGTDFSNVRLHTDSKAADLSRSLQAKAFTYGNDIFFNSGQYQPHSAAGQRLIAHELTHVVQQGGKVGREIVPKEMSEEDRQLYQTAYMNDIIENYLKPGVCETRYGLLHTLLNKLDKEHFTKLLEMHLAEISYYLKDCPDGFMNMYIYQRRTIIDFRVKNQKDFLVLICGPNSDGLGFNEFRKLLKRYGYEDDGIYGDPDKHAVELAAAKEVVRDCKNNIDNLIRFIQYQIDIDNSYILIDSLARLFGGETRTVIADFITVLQAMKIEVKDAEATENIHEIWTVVKRIAPLIDVITERYYSYRNNILEGAEDGLAIAYITKTTAFAILATAGSALLGGGIAASMLTGGTVSALDNTVSQIANDSPFNGAERDKSFIIGVGQAALGAMPGKILEGNGKATLQTIGRGLSSNPAGVVIGTAISLLTDELIGSNPRMIGPLLTESDSHEVNDYRDYLIALYYAPKAGIEYDIYKKDFTIVEVKKGDDKDMQIRILNMLKSFIEKHPGVFPKSQ